MAVRFPLPLNHRIPHLCVVARPLLSETRRVETWAEGARVDIRNMVPGRASGPAPWLPLEPAARCMGGRLFFVPGDDGSAAPAGDTSRNAHGLVALAIGS